MRIITLNVNGIRAAARKGFFAWMQSMSPDIVCLQELKAQEKDLAPEILAQQGYHGYFHYAEKKGYSGVAIYSRLPAAEVVRGLGFKSADAEGRYVAIRIGNLWIASLYLPSGTAGEERQAVKFAFLELYAKHLQSLQAASPAREHILCGDWNIAHKQIDLKNWRSNQKNTGFLPEERAFMEALFTEWGYCDAFRLINQDAEQYTWWSNRGRAYENNVGWRIDYQVLSDGLKQYVTSTSIYKGERFSDHAPLIVDYAFELEA